MARYLPLLIVVVVWAAVLGQLGGQGSAMQPMPGMEQAEHRLEAFAQGINRNEPGVIYEHLRKDYQAAIPKDEFIQHWNKERSYPYLTPLYIYIEEIELADDARSGMAFAVVAARLPGEIMRLPFYWQEDNYYVDAFSTLIDGSYLEKFERISQ